MFSVNFILNRDFLVRAKELYSENRPSSEFVELSVGIVKYQGY